MSLQPFYYRGLLLNPDQQQSVNEIVKKMQLENDSSSVKKLHSYLHKYHNSKMHEAMNVKKNLLPKYKLKLNLNKIEQSN